MKLAGSLAFAALAALAACTGGIDPTTTDEAVVPLDDDGKADAASETRVRTGDTSLWIRNEIKRATRAEGRQVFTVRGRTSRDLTDGMAFVFDDVVGDWAKLSARTFEVTYAHDDGGLADGGDHFVRLNFKHSAGRPDSLTARVVSRFKLGSFAGTGVSLEADVKPVVSGGRVVFRLKGKTSSKIYGLRVSAGDVNIDDIRTLDDTHFQVDLLRDHVSAIAGTSAELRFEVDLSSGTKTKRAKLSMRLAALGMTSDDPYEVWPPATCEDEVRECLSALPAGTLDLASCGEAVPVMACQGQVGVSFDDVAFNAAMASARVKLSQSKVFAGDSAALIGEDRATSFTEMAEQTVEGNLEGLFGTWYPDAAGRDAAATAAVDRAIDLAYARPLDIYGEAHAPAPGNLAATRQVLADALLTYLDGIDLVHTEFGRPLETLARQYRARHVAALRFWREEATVVSSSATQDVYAGNWLDPYVEITVNRATGQVVSVFFEID